MIIRLNDILNIPDEDLSNVKIRFNTNNNKEFNPIKLFKENKLELLNAHFHNYKTKKSFYENQIAIGLARISRNKWLLFDISKITKDLNKYDGMGYEYEPIENYQKYFGRLVISYKNKTQNMIRKAKSVIDECEVCQLLEDTFDNDLFPGYENVNIAWKDLNRVITKSTWTTALENQKGVYLITDKLNGRMYVGSAYGKDMILGRWKNYILNGHGGNEHLKNLNFDYIKKNFTFSILDIFKSTIDDDIIIRRESWWKKTLKTEEFGYNYNPRGRKRLGNKKINIIQLK